MTEYPWYDEVKDSDDIYQGDIFMNCPIFVPTGEIVEREVSGDVINYEVIVMSQSCDLENANVDIVLVCPIYPIVELQKQNDKYKGRNGRKALEQGTAIGYHALNLISEGNFDRPHYFVDFRNVFGIHIDTLKELCTKQKTRLRVLPPYREHLAQAFARYFMRVGLPVNIDPIPNYT